MYVPPHLKLVKTLGKGYGVVANKLIREGEVVCELFFDSVRPRKIAVNAVQGGADAFLSNNLGTIDDRFNHSCNPTTRLDLSQAIFEALRDIQEGEEITWNYLTTEYDLSQDQADFDCFCNSKNCVGKICGFKYLSLAQQQELWPYLSPFLRTMMP